jgi:hypothetical protein
MQVSTQCGTKGTILVSRSLKEVHVSITAAMSCSSCYLGHRHLAAHLAWPAVMLLPSLLLPKLGEKVLTINLSCKVLAQL